MALLTGVSTEDLRSELTRREEEGKRLEEQKRMERFRKLRSVLTKELIDVLVPEHTRTSCSDDNRRNGFYSNGEDSAPRCERCALMEFAEGSGDDHTLRTWFDFQPKRKKEQK